MTRITRRAFFKLMGVGATATGVAGWLGKSLVDRLPRRTVPELGHLTPSDWVPTVCRICAAGCGVLTRVVDGRAVKIDGNPYHPVSQGKVCPRAQAALQVLYDPDRIQTPLRRVGERGENNWEPISWEEAIDLVAEQLRELESQDQANSLLFLHNAPPGQMRDLIDYFCQAFGTPNAVSADGLDAERTAHALTQGWFDLAAHDWKQTSYALFFGGSYLEDWQPQVHMLQSYSYMRRGRPDRRSRLVQIGPRFSVSAAKSDEWIPLPPGLQGILALGLAHVIVREQLYDQSFVEEHGEGFDEFAALVLEQYDPATVAEITGVRTTTIQRLAREFAGSGRAVAVAGRGLEEGPNALFSHLAIHSLNGLVGSIDVPGGILRPQPPPLTPFPSLPELDSAVRLDGAGTITFPLATNAFHALPERIVEGIAYPTQALFLYEVNPLFEGVSAARWREAFDNIPLIVSFSSFMDESTLQADLVLPNHAFLERWVDGTPPGGIGRSTMGLGRPVVEPVYSTRHTGDVLLELGRAVNSSLAGLFPWTDFEEMLRFRAQGLFEVAGSIQADSFSDFWSEFVDRGVWAGEDYVFGQSDNALTTPSGRFQFGWNQLEETLGAHGANTESVTEPHYAGEEEEYPLHLIPYQVIADAGCRAPNAPLLWEIYGLHIKETWRSWVELNPELAHELHIDDGDMVWVESPQGRIELKARVYEGAMPEAVYIPLGGGHTAGGRWAEQVKGGNVAELVVTQIDPLVGTAAWCSTRVKVYKE